MKGVKCPGHSGGPTRGKETGDQIKVQHVRMCMGACGSVRGETAEWPCSPQKRGKKARKAVGRGIGRVGPFRRLNAVIWRPLGARGGFFKKKGGGLADKKGGAVRKKRAGVCRVKWRLPANQFYVVNLGLDGPGCG